MIYIVIIIFIIVLCVWIYISNNMSTEQNPKNNPGVSAIQNSQAGSQLFSSSQFAQNAYLISTPTYDATVNKALSGFSVARTVLSDGSTQYVLNATNPEYQTQTYTVNTGEKLYFIERNLSDDSVNEDKFIGDDTAVLVDAGGYIIKQ